MMHDKGCWTRDRPEMTAVTCVRLKMGSLKTAFHRTGTHRHISVLSDFISHKKKKKQESKMDCKHLQVDVAEVNPQQLQRQAG